MAEAPLPRARRAYRDEFVDYLPLAFLSLLNQAYCGDTYHDLESIDAYTHRRSLERFLVLSGTFKARVLYILCLPLCA